MAVLAVGVAGAVGSLTAVAAGPAAAAAPTSGWTAGATVGTDGTRHAGFKSQCHLVLGRLRVVGLLCRRRVLLGLHC